MTKPYLLAHQGGSQIDAILQTTFSNAFSLIKIYEPRQKFHWSLFLTFDLKYSSVVSDNGLAPTCRQAIIWTNDS